MISSFRIIICRICVIRRNFHKIAFFRNHAKDDIANRIFAFQNKLAYCRHAIFQHRTRRDLKDCTETGNTSFNSSLRLGTCISIIKIYLSTSLYIGKTLPKLLKLLGTNSISRIISVLLTLLTLLTLYICIDIKRRNSFLNFSISYLHFSACC